MFLRERKPGHIEPLRGCWPLVIALITCELIRDHYVFGSEIFILRNLHFHLEAHSLCIIRRAFPAAFLPHMSAGLALGCYNQKSTPGEAREREWAPGAHRWVRTPSHSRNRFRMRPNADSSLQRLLLSLFRCHHRLPRKHQIANTSTGKK